MGQKHEVFEDPYASPIFFARVYLVNYYYLLTTTGLPLAPMQPTKNNSIRLILAPREGVVDSLMRSMLTQIGGYDRCVTEFVRVSQTVLPPRVFYRLCPELKHGGLTPAGVPVYVQLLGSDPELMAANAAVLAKLNAPGIDLNFGCPAKTVNKSEGGAVMLRHPDRIAAICGSVRDAVPRNIPVTAKIRLGFDDDHNFEKIVDAAIGSGINELIIHARTRQQAYRPPAHWHRLADAVARSPIPIIANGELWSASDVQTCGGISGCDTFMLARGALCRPDLGLAVRAHLADESHPALAWRDVQPLLSQFMAANAAAYDLKYAVNPIKQWLMYLKCYYPQAAVLFAQVKRINDAGLMAEALSEIVFSDAA